MNLKKNKKSSKEKIKEKRDLFEETVNRIINGKRTKKKEKHKIQVKKKKAIKAKPEKIKKLIHHRFNKKIIKHPKNKDNQAKIKHLPVIKNAQKHIHIVSPKKLQDRAIKSEEPDKKTKPLEKHPELLESKDTLHNLVTLQSETTNEDKDETAEKEDKTAEKENGSKEEQDDQEEAEVKNEERNAEIEQIEKEENKESHSLAKTMQKLFGRTPKPQSSVKQPVVNPKENIPAADKANEKKEDKELQTTQVTVTQEKFDGETIDAYTIKIDGASADIKIIKNEIGTKYIVNIPKISIATSALLNDIREELIAITSVSMQELIDPKAFASIKKKFKEEAAKLIEKKIPTIKEETESFLVGTLMQEMLGIGKIEYLINDPNLEEIVIVSAKEPIKVYSKKYGWLSTNIILEREEITINYSNIIARRVGRQITVLSPLLDAHLVTGDRVNAVLYPINTKGNTIVIRKFARDPYTIIDLINNKTCDLETSALLWLAIEYEMNVIISGGTASGKTVLLNACMPFIPPNQRIISIEDTKELALPEFLYWTPLVTRLPNAEGKGSVSMLDLLINSLRMRPDRIILGEMRKHEEAMVLFEAMHTGHSVYATLHADSAAETISRLVHPPLDIPANLLQAIHLNVVMFRDRRRGIRRILQIAEIEVEGETAKANTLYRWSPESDKLVKHSKSSRFFEEISRHTSMTEEEINKELNLKKKILSWMIDHKIRKLEDLGKTMNLYYQNKDLLLKKISKNDTNFILNYEK